MDAMQVPFVDLKVQYHSIKNEIDSAISEILESTQFVGGKKHDAFESDFAAYVEGKYGVGAANGTCALHLALEALGVGPGDEVITACDTFIATTEAIMHAGADVVLVDALDASMNIDPQQIEDAITDRTRVIIPVHLYGQSADMDAVRDIAKRHSLHIVSDAAQAHGARYKGSRKAIHGELTCYSFYPGKNLGAYGDAGMVVTDDGELAERMRVLANHGREGKYLHCVAGYNYRMDTMQAAILDVKLRHLDAWTERRRSRAKRYDAAFDGSPIRPVHEAPGNYHVYHLYVVRLPERDHVLAELGKRGIAAGIHYPVPLHLQKAYAHLGLGKGTFPVAERAAAEIISLPMYPELTDEMVDYVAATLKELVR
jgi:dTDP-4-amino-4,6-dideoxygalactose transaminase